jgi:hypothetical protein
MLLPYLIGGFIVSIVKGSQHCIDYYVVFKGADWFNQIGAKPRGPRLEEAALL